MKTENSDKNNKKTKFTDKIPPTYRLTLKITGSVFLILTLAAMISFGIASLIFEYGNYNSQSKLTVFLIIILAISIGIGTILSVFLSWFVLKKISPYMNAIKSITQGDFSVRIPSDKLKFGKEKELAENFNIMVQELSSTETLREDFVSNFSHEFKTPIVSVSGFAALLKDPNLTASERNEYLDIIIDETNRLVELSDNVLNLTKLEAQESIGENEIFRLDEQIRQCILLFERELNESNINVNLSLKEINYSGNKKLLKQLWVNLISNSVKFSPGGEITISAEPADKAVKVIIKDTGCGMDEYTLKHIFDKFFQGDRSRTTSGSGLGLPIVKRILELTGGEINVESTPGNGSVFTVILK